MSFLYGAFLTALVAAGIPLLLHLLSRQRLPIIPFSSLEFLQRLQKRKTRRVQIRQLILLALRTLAVAALVLAFARPALKSGAASGAKASVEMVILIDNSLPATAESRDGSLFNQIVSRAGGLLDLADAGDRVTLIPVTAPHKLLSAPAGSRTLLKSRLEDLQPSYAAPDWRQAFAAADTILSGSVQFNRELYIVSPFYGGIWDSLGDEWEESPLSPDTPKRLFFAPVGPERLDNSAVEQVQVRSTILQPGQPVELDVTVANYGASKLADATVSIYLDDERVARASVDVPPGGTASRSITVSPARGGALAGWAKLEHLDALGADNRSHFVLDIPDTVRLLAVSGDPATRAVIGSVFSGVNTGNVSVSQRGAGDWETVKFAGYDAILLAGVDAVSPGAAARLVDYVKSGGGLMFLPGVNPDLAGLSRGLFDGLGMGDLTGILSGAGVTWGKFDLDHPIFSGVFEGRGAPKSPRFDFVLQLAPARGDLVVIPYSDKSPFLIERKVDDGRALVFTSPLATESSDFIFSGIFSPLIYRGVIYLAAARPAADANWIVGGGRRIFVPAAQPVPAKLASPDETVRELFPKPVAEGVEYTLDEVAQPGIYTLSVPGSSARLFAADVPRGLGDLNRTDMNGLASHWKAVVIAPEAEQLAGMVHQVRYGRELWMPVAFAFMVLLLSESLIGRSWRKSSE